MMAITFLSKLLTCECFSPLHNLGKPIPPVMTNKEVELKGCYANLTWVPPRRYACGITKYVIHYREIKLHGSKADWSEIPISQVNKTFHLIPLLCDATYEIAMSAWSKTQSDWSSSWQVKTNSGVTYLKKIRREMNNSTDGQILLRHFVAVHCII